MLASSSCTGLGEIGVPEQMRGETWSGVPPTACADSGGQHRATVDSGPAERQGRDRRCAPERAAGNPRFYRPHRADRERCQDGLESAKG